MVGIMMVYLVRLALVAFDLALVAFDLALDSIWLIALVLF